MYRIAKVAQFIEKEGLNRILFIIKGRFTQEEIDAYNLLRTVIFDGEVVKYTTVVRAGFSSFRKPEKCEEDRRELIEENEQIADIIKNKILYINNLPIVDDGDEDGKRSAIKARLESRKRVLTHLVTCDKAYKPGNLDTINQRIGEYMTESEKQAKAIKDLQNTLEEEKELSKKEREDLTNELENARVKYEEASNNAHQELAKALKENQEKFAEELASQKARYEKADDREELIKLLREKDESNYQINQEKERLIGMVNQAN